MHQQPLTLAVGDGPGDEERGLKTLMSRHGTCEAKVDHLLRTQKLVDLYRVVREGLRASEPGHSIQNLETFYMQKRDGAQQTGTTPLPAAQSLVTRNPVLESQAIDPRVVFGVAGHETRASR